MKNSPLCAAFNTLVLVLIYKILTIFFGGNVNDLVTIAALYYGVLNNTELRK